MRTLTRAPRLVAVAAAAALTASLAACADGEEAPAADETTAAEEAGTLTIYSGRDEELVQPILDQLSEATGVEVEVRYAGTGELAAQLLEEGEDTPADLFFSQDAGALGALAREGLLAPLPEEVTSLVPAEFADAEGRWVATSGRARVIAFSPERAPEVTEMTSIDDVLDEQYRGRIGVAPTNASFQAFVTALRVQRGEDGAREWLEQLTALEPQTYDGNGAIMDGLGAGEVDLGLVNHYYLYPRKAELGDDFAVENHFLDSDDPGALINVAGVGVLAGSDNEDAAVAAVEFLLSDESQQYFADETAEYPVVEGVTSSVYELAPIGDLTTSSIDLNDLESLDETLALLDEVGLT